jgi:predicted nucleic acid-binding protein
MYRQRRTVERIVTMEVMRLERRLASERRDIADALAPAGRPRSARDRVRRLSPRPSSG